MDLQINQEQRDIEREYLDFLDDEVNNYFTNSKYTSTVSFVGRRKKIL